MGQSKYKKLRRLCINPLEDIEPKMHTLYECVGKNGTTATTRFWFLSEPTKGAKVVGIDENSRYSPYMNGHAFRYAEFSLFKIDDVHEDGYVKCHGV